MNRTSTLLQQKPTQHNNTAAIEANEWSRTTKTTGRGAHAHNNDQHQIFGAPQQQRRRRKSHKMFDDVVVVDVQIFVLLSDRERARVAQLSPAAAVMVAGGFAIIFTDF